MKRLMCVMLVVAAGFVSAALADAKDDAKARRKARREHVEKLVKAGEAEVGDDGYLAAKGQLDAAKAELVKAENADRKIGFEAIAKANGMTEEQLLKQRADALKKARSAK